MKCVDLNADLKFIFCVYNVKYMVARICSTAYLYFNLLVTRLQVKLTNCI